jgi:hypothetical protein
MHLRHNYNQLCGYTLMYMALARLKNKMLALKSYSICLHGNEDVIIIMPLGGYTIDNNQSNIINIKIKRNMRCPVSLYLTDINIWLVHSMLQACLEKDFSLLFNIIK